MADLQLLTTIGKCWSSNPPNSARAEGGPYVHCNCVNREEKLVSFPRFNLSNPSVPPLASCLLFSLHWTFIQNEILPKNKLSWGSRFKNSNRQNFLNTEKQYFYGISSVPHFSILPSSYYVLDASIKRLLTYFKKYIISPASAPENKSVHTY